VKLLSSTKKMLCCGLAVCWALHPLSLRACAACYGQSDSPMAQGMNWGIFSLLGVVVVVLGSISTFFVFLARRAAAQPPPPGPDYDPLLANDPFSITD